MKTLILLVAATLALAGAQAVGEHPPDGALRLTVDLAGLPADSHLTADVRRYEDAGLLCRLPHPPKPEVVLRGGRVQVLSLRPLPAGRYRVRLDAPGRRAVQADVAVPPGATGRAVLAVGPPGVNCAVVWRGGLRAGERRVRLNLNPRGPILGTDVGHASFSAPAAGAVCEGLRPGPYLAIVWDRGLLRPVEVTADQRAPLELAPPPDGYLSGGAAEVTVVLRCGGRPLRYTLVGLAPAAAGPEGWMRYAEGGSSARFEGVPPGRYRLLVFDGIFGAEFGFPSPAVREIAVEDGDVEVAFDL